MSLQTRKSSNTVWHNATVTRERRERLNNHRSAIL
ncbi:MAG TPA: adenylyl-sulfate kinase, partial [Gammaproteobacteria bacterium]|nr:adenylyl-sulfate kinase [Gammaproteobacteria bacterium]